ncbi:FadR/GntR family transcriptional regulator [Psychromicrobium lacuslunae]|uniref:GntR family transcriptional regulator n=1 Tax=Psychromicrobium lacuslunae TaxID=1618207 RepID=A0A0D4C3G1_9MICC|nr:FCD domain-containing protein [Psychromicrobium lacuslunae]AJT43064.1 GntR family transcriptional regulator [Psychromicrobium lacuslunae]
MKSHQPVLAWIEQQLSQGALRIGQRLPSERALAEQFNLSRASIREAIAVLDAMGVVRAAVGSGPGSGTIIIAQPASALGSALRFHVASSHLPVADIVQTRLLFETWACQHSQLQSQALIEAARLLEEMQALATPQTEEFLTLDIRFHLALAESAGNVVVSAMMLSLRESIRQYTSSIVALLPDWRRTSARLHQEHLHVLELLRQGDRAAAAACIAEHIEGFYQEGLREK